MSCSVLEGYRWAEMVAREYCSKLVYMVEEDICALASPSPPLPVCPSRWRLVAVRYHALVLWIRCWISQSGQW